MHLISDSARRGLLGHIGVHAVGDSIRNGEPVVIVHVHDDSHVDAIPSEVEGVPVVIEFEEMDTLIQFGDADPGSTHRPVQAGTKTAIYDGDGIWQGSGTLGFTLTDGSRYYLTSNNHVWADDYTQRIGYRVTQPSGTGNTIAHLSNFVPLFEGNDVTVDLAWSEVVDDLPITNEVLNIGKHAPTPVDPQVGDQIVYTGSNTGTVTGEVVEVNKSGGVISADPDDNRTYGYVDCFGFTPSAGPGDSGSAVVRNDGEPYSPMGQAFAAGATTTAHKLSNVLTETGFSIISEPRIPEVPEYKGRPREDYFYCGSETETYEQWVSGAITTEQFASQTPPGEGTAMLTLSGCYQGRPRDEYTYCGDETDDFQDWVNGNISTETFSFRTAPGNGTDALTLGECQPDDGDGGSDGGDGGDGGDGETDRSGQAALAAGVLAVGFLASRDRN